MTIQRSAEAGSGPTSGRPDLVGVVGLVALLMLIAAAITAVLSDYQQVGWLTWLVLVLVSGCFAVSYLALRHVAGPWLDRGRRGPWHRLAVHALVLVGAVALGSEVSVRTLELLGGEPASRSRRDFQVVGFTITAAMVLVEEGYRRLRGRIRDHELREERLRQQAMRAQLAALQARTDPHFLFNSLNTVAGLVEENPAAGAEALERLAALYRHALDGSRAVRVPLRQELQAVRSYLEIEGLRMGERLRWTIEADGALLDRPVPPLILQPLVENAVRHGVAPRRRGGRVAVRVACEAGGSLCLEVEDDGVGQGRSPERGSGTALVDLAERLAIISREARLERTAGPLGGNLARIVLPPGGEPAP